MISLCPKVRSLNWENLFEEEYCDPEDIPFLCMPLFMGAFTQKVQFSLEGMGNAELSFVQSILPSFPSIKNITILNMHRSESESLLEVLAECFSQGLFIQGVDEEDIASISLAMERHLEGVENLNRLEVSIDRQCSSLQLSGSYPLGGEANTIVESTFQWRGMFMIIFRSPLRIIKTCMSQWPCMPNDSKLPNNLLKPQDLEQTFQAIGLHCSHGRLISLEILSELKPHDPPSFTDATAIMPLFAFRSLTKLSLELNTPLHLGNCTIRDMVSAWPQLTILHLEISGWLGRSSVTPAGLAHLLRLPLLHTLDISINAEVVDVDFSLDSAYNLPKNINTRSLNLLDSTISDSPIGPMVVLLSLIAPNLKDVDSRGMFNQRSFLSSEVVKANRERWRNVSSQIKEMHW